MSHPRPPGMLRLPSYALGQLYRAAHTRIESALKDAGLSMQTHLVLVCLDEFGEMSQQQISDRGGVDRSDLVRRIDVLESLGQVKRQPDPEDRRRHVVSLTPKGRQALSRSQKIASRVTRDVLGNLTAVEQRDLHRLVLVAIGEPPALADTNDSTGGSDERAG